MFREMPRETLINQTFGSWSGEGNYASIVAILSLLFYGSTPPGDKCVNYYISYPGLLLAAPLLMALALSPSLQLSPGQRQLLQSKDHCLEAMLRGTWLSALLCAD